MNAAFTIHAAPTGKARPRVTSHGTYTPRKTKEYEALVRSEYGIQCGNTHFGDAPLVVYITAYYPIPKSASKAKREKMIHFEIVPKVKPDFDNVCKAVCDALNGIAYRDDAQIVEAHFHKWYGEEPCVKVVIEEYHP